MEIKNKNVRFDFTRQFSIVNDSFNFIVYILTGKQALLTCGSERTAKHGETSCHYSGNAGDYRSKWYTKDMKTKIMSEFKKAFPTPDVEIYLECEGLKNEHFHIEYQPKRPT